MKIQMPKEYVNVMITYIGKVRVRDKYYDHYEKNRGNNTCFLYKK